MYNKNVINNSGGSMEDSKELKKKNKKKIAIISIIVAFLLIGGLSVVFYPRIKLKGKDIVKVSLNSKYVEEGANATLGNVDITKDLTIKGSVDTQKPGRYEIEYSVKEGFITTTTKRIIEVVDEEKPVITLKGKEETYVCANKEYTEEGYTATDNYDGDITDKVVVNKTDTEITYTVEDSSKNQTVITRTLINKDGEGPKITITGDKTVYVTNGSKYSDKGATATDNCDGDLTSKITKTGSVNTTKNGTYKITYEVTDSSGNKSKAERTVIVRAKASTTTTKTTSNPANNTTGVIYLTFDDGPSSTITAKVLDILKKKGVKATFFVINHSNDLNYLIKREDAEGHAVALHSYTHNYKTIYSSKDAYFNDLKKISDKVKSITGKETKVIRFPGGTSNTVSRKYSKGIMTYLAKEVVNRGYHYFDWNVSSGDAGGAKTKEKVYSNVVNGLRYNRANVVLMHDFEGNYKTLNALSDIIDYGLRNNYKFETIDMDTPMVTHRPNN